MYGCLIVILMGLTLNTLAVLVLCTPTMWNNFFNRLLFCLAVFDTLYLLCGLSEWFRNRMQSPIQLYMFVNVVYPVRSVVMCCSIYTTVALTLERYQAITSPVEHRSRGTTPPSRRLLYYIGPVFGISVIYYLPKFFDLDVNKKTECLNSTNVDSANLSISESGLSNCTTSYDLLPTALRTNDQYHFWYINISNIVVTCIVPFTLLVYMNCRTLSSLRQFRQRQPSANLNSAGQNQESKSRSSDVKKTFILFSIVILFVVCHALRIFLNIDEFLHLEKMMEDRDKGCSGEKYSTKVAVPISEILLLFNSGANFIIYIFFDKGFEQVLKRYFCAATNPLDQINNIEMRAMTQGSTPRISLKNKFSMKGHARNIDDTDTNNVELTEMTSTLQV